MSRDTLFLDEYVYDTPLNDNNNKQHKQQQTGQRERLLEL